MSSNLHPTAIVNHTAQLDSSVIIGPYSIIGSGVCIDAATEIGSHCVIDGQTIIGKNNVFYRFCSIGGVPQDKKYNNEKTRLVIGDRNTIREFTTFNLGTIQDNGITTVGNDNWIMSYVHIAHDCHIGNHTVLANSVQLGGHIYIGDWAVIGGLTGVHQFSKIGSHTMIGGNSSLKQDVPPFILCSGNPCRPVGINIEGLKRLGMPSNVISEIRYAYKILYRRGLSLVDACAKLRSHQQQNPNVAIYLQMILDFLENSKRGIIRS